MDGFAADVLSKMDHAETSDKLKKSEIAYGTLNDVHGLSSHPALRSTVISNPDGNIRFPAPPAIMDNSPDNSLREVPALNQHGEAIRAEFAKN